MTEQSKAPLIFTGSLNLVAAEIYYLLTFRDFLKSGLPTNLPITAHTSLWVSKTYIGMSMDKKGRNFNHILIRGPDYTNSIGLSPRPIVPT